MLDSNLFLSRLQPLHYQRFRSVPTGRVLHCRRELHRFVHPKSCSGEWWDCSPFESAHHCTDGWKCRCLRDGHVHYRKNRPPLACQNEFGFALKQESILMRCKKWVNSIQRRSAIISYLFNYLWLSRLQPGYWRKLHFLLWVPGPFRGRRCHRVGRDGFYCAARLDHCWCGSVCLPKRCRKYCCAQSDRGLLQICKRHLGGRCRFHSDGWSDLNLRWSKRPQSCWNESGSQWIGPDRIRERKCPPFGRDGFHTAPQSGLLLLLNSN